MVSEAQEDKYSEEEVKKAIADIIMTLAKEQHDQGGSAIRNETDKG